MTKVISFVRPVIVLFVAVTILGGGSLALWWNIASGPLDPSDHRDIEVVVPQGSSAAEVGIILYQKKLIRDPFVFRLASHIYGGARHIVAGAYQISPNRSMSEVLHILQRGPLDIWVTIPEGWRREQIAQKMLSVLVSQTKSFDPVEFFSLTDGLEGHLFPDTYLIPQTADAATVVSLLTKTFAQKTKVLFTQSFPDGLNQEEVLTLASLVERETGPDPTERALVAGILLKRLKAGWSLQADATVKYARDSFPITTGSWESYKFWQPLSASDKSLNSPYNTYLHDGLPPGPIANPGLSAIKAVLNAQDSPYWYYLHDQNGHIHFAETYDQQNANVAKYL